MDSHQRRILKRMGHNVNPAKNIPADIVPDTKSPLGRSTFEFYGACLITVLCAVFPMTFYLKAGFVIMVCAFVVDICFHSRQTIKLSLFQKLISSAFGVAAIVALFYSPLREQYKSEHDIQKNQDYIVRWGSMNTLEITDSDPIRVLSGDPKTQLVVRGQSLMKYRDRYKLMGIVMHIVPGDKSYTQKSILCKSEVYDIRDEDIDIEIPYTTDFLAEAVNRGLAIEDYMLLAIPIDLNPDDFGTIDGAEKLGARIIAAVSKTNSISRKN